MAKRISERARWTQIYFLSEPGVSEQSAAYAKQKHGELRAVVEAFEKVGRVVRVEVSQHGSGLIFKARRA